MKITRLKSLAAALGLAAYFTTSSTHAQNVTFGAAETITGDANLIDAADTAGAINVDAILPNGNVNNGAANPSPGYPVTLDGVIFNAAMFTSTSTSDGTITLTATSGSFSQYGYNSGGYPTSASASASFAQVMSSGGVFGSGPGVITISASALITGDTYALQIFNFSNDGVDESTVFSSGSSVTLFDSNGTSTDPASFLGQFTTGTFTATGANETIDFANASGGYTPVVGAINLENITDVPEPSTYALMAGGMLLLVLGLRHRRQPTV
jgi:PEP-CTERM motif